MILKCSNKFYTLYKNPTKYKMQLIYTYDGFVITPRPEGVRKLERELWQQGPLIGPVTASGRL